MLATFGVCTPYGSVASRRLHSCRARLPQKLLPRGLQNGIPPFGAPRVPCVRRSVHLVSQAGHHRPAETCQAASAQALTSPTWHNPSPPSHRPWAWKWLGYGVLIALLAQFVVRWVSYLPLWQRMKRRFVWWNQGLQDQRSSTYGSYAGAPDTTTTAMVLYSDNAESVEWFNMCWRKAWRVYQRGLEKWLAALLQPVFDNLIAEAHVPKLLQRLRILEFTLDHEAPYFDNMRRRTSRKDSDLNGVVDVRYTGGVRMLLLLEVGRRRWRIKIPVLVSDLDLECKMWLKIRLAPMCPWFGMVSLAFVGPPTIKVQLAPYNRVRLMKIPFLQPLLARLLTEDLPGLMVLPRRLEINIPPAVTTVAEAAVGHDNVMRAVASAVLQADALEHALMAALPLGPQSAAGGVTLPESFRGELQVTLLEARHLPVWGFPWQSNPYCRLKLGAQTVLSRRDDDTSRAGSHRAPVWNQEFQLLVESPSSQALEVTVLDSHLTGRPEVGHVILPLSRIPKDGTMTAWLPLQAGRVAFRAQGELRLQVEYKAFEDDEVDAGYREGEAFSGMLQAQGISDVKSAADASSRAAVAASAAMAAVAVTKAAAARAAAKASFAAKAAKLQQAAEAALVKASNGAGDGVSKLALEDIEKQLEEGQAPVDLDPKAVEDAMASGLGSAASNGASQNGLQTTEEGDSYASDPLQGIDPDELFPGIEFRISEDDDEDMPYTRPPDFQPKPRSSQSQPRTKAASQKAAMSRGADAVRALQAQQKAGAKRARSAAWRGQRGKEEKLGGGPRGENGKEELLAEEPSVGRGPTQKKDDGFLPAVVDAEVQVTADAEITKPDPTAMNPLTGQASVQSRDGTQPVATEANATASTEQAEDSVPAQPPRTRGIFPWWKASEEEKAEGPNAEPPAKEGADRDPDDGRGDGALKAAGSQGGSAGSRSWTQRWLGWLPGLRQGQQDVTESADTEGRDGESTVQEVVVPKDLPLDAIAAEVQATWRLKEEDAERLVRAAVARSERPWLILLTLLSGLSAALLAIVLWQVQRMP